MFTSVGARILCYLTDAGCTEVQASALAGSLDTYLSAANDDCRASGKEGAATVYIADDDLRGRQHQSLAVAHIAAFLQFGHHVELHLLHLCLALPDLCQVFLNTTLECGELFLPILEYIVHFLLFYLFTLTSLP